jgi:hypothetical protein
MEYSRWNIFVDVGAWINVFLRIATGASVDICFREHDYHNKAYRIQQQHSGIIIKQISVETFS